ncbi:hypothetical protein THAOC_14259 [Thalassiosira oceanica]|uniref:Uncharacterized protein n=1 Tax=Thalassiosira oceanica TaxID=159749 RepID=K0SFM1_THAOC|nr:hypothetical protein THAOC_14259 [Thalassiosira oceanica]|eukprot:EJK64948.1 hypothetical protein THAOC_14259 [Thalassiosira oceanica]
MSPNLLFQPLPGSPASVQKLPKWYARHEAVRVVPRDSLAVGGVGALAPALVGVCRGEAGVAAAALGPLPLLVLERSMAGPAPFSRDVALLGVEDGAPPGPLHGLPLVVHLTPARALVQRAVETHAVLERVPVDALAIISILFCWAD